MVNFREGIRRKKEYDATLDRVAEYYKVDKDLLQSICDDVYYRTHKSRITIVNTIAKFLGTLDEELRNKQLEELRNEVDKIFSN